MTQLRFYEPVFSWQAWSWLWTRRNSRAMPTNSIKDQPLSKHDITSQSKRSTDGTAWPALLVVCRRDCVYLFKRQNGYRVWRRCLKQTFGCKRRPAVQSSSACPEGKGPFWDNWARTWPWPQKQEVQTLKLAFEQFLPLDINSRVTWKNVRLGILSKMSSRHHPLWSTANVSVIK